MKIAIITGSSGLIGSETAKFFHNKGFEIVGIDNNFRKYFFGKEACTDWNTKKLKSEIKNYKHNNLDIRNTAEIEKIFKNYKNNIKVIIHCAAQPSHDWAAKEPFSDFSINATGTLNLLELTRKYCPEAVFIFASTNKVYGDNPNKLPLIEQEKRWELDTSHSYYKQGIDESMSVDRTTHSLFGASKLAADILVQEYGNYFHMKTACFRCGCLTGPSHSGTKLHGFLSYLIKCIVENTPYEIIGYKGKQVRDNIHSFDLVNAFWHYYLNPKAGEVYNMGGGRLNNCSILEAIDLSETICQKKLQWHYTDRPRIGDHIWWISDYNKFQRDYPEWGIEYSIQKMLSEIFISYNSRTKI